ncbi:MAG: hypothetical protein ACYCSI_11535 [Solirubrobacteraceae bacterium]
MPSRTPARRTASYGTPRLERATACARPLRFELSSAGLAGLLAALARLPWLIAYLLTVPSREVRLSRSEQGHLIRAQLALRRLGIPRYRLAQGVLELPASFQAYLRGHHRQAVRTNIRRAREQGVECRYTAMTAASRARLPADALTLAAFSETCEVAERYEIEFPGNPGECWWACDANGKIVGRAWLTVDSDCALLHTLLCTRKGVRWLLHSAIVERLCAGGCPLLLTNSFDAPLLEPGQQYFQQLLGYTIARLRPRPRRDSSELAFGGAGLSATSKALITTLAVGACAAMLGRFVALAIARGAQPRLAARSKER